ncbi:hypothetical protein GA0115255_126693 [Streptomyces sp. Ncost-T6T-2b]|nr:hypothetical protein GA0115255_126693 [Streptomyces sp. Ncost-T6T-2b]
MASTSRGEGEVAHDRVEQGLDALVLERGATEHRGDGDGVGAALRRQRDAADGLVQLLLGGLVALQVQLHHGVVVLGHGLEELAAPLGGGLLEVVRDLDDVVHLALGGLFGVHEGLHRHEVDNAREVRFGADGELHDDRGRAEAVHDHLDAAEEVRTGAVELVDEADTRHAVAVRLTPDSLGLRLDARDTVEHGDGAVEDAERTLHLDGEVDVTRGVDDVDGVVNIVERPVAGRRGGRDRDAALLLLLHPVHRGSAVVDFTDLVAHTGVEEDPLSGGRLARVDVGHDPNVADLGQVKRSGGHKAQSSLGLDGGSDYQR